MRSVNGLHHITAIAGPAQENVDFYAGVLGMRLVKKSVNQDDPGTDHLFYADAAASALSSPHPHASQRFPAGAMKLRFWGVRGSVPWAIPSAIGHGCNTSCLELRNAASGETLILDAGSGIVGLGERLSGPPRDLAIVLTHYHWDHIQGLPFLAQLYEPGWRPMIYAPGFEARDTEWVNTIFKSPFFPVPYERLPNPPEVRLLGRGPAAIGGFELSSVPLNHPGGALAYRVRGSRGDLVYATDHEFGDPAFDEPLAAFARGASAIILDAHYTPAEIGSYQGWGHSDWRRSAEFAAANDIARLWLFHHKPGRTDEELVQIGAEARKIFPATETACEGESIDV